MTLEVQAGIDQLHALGLFELLQRASQGHIAELMVVPVCFSVGGDMHHLRPGPGRRESAHEAVRKCLAAPQEPLERDRL